MRSRLKKNGRWGSPWELREFTLQPGSLPVSMLKLVPVKQEPAVKYNAKLENAEVKRMVEFVNGNSLSIASNNYTVPLSVPVSMGSPSTTEFLGGKAHTNFPPTGPPPTAHHWNGTDIVASSTFIVSDQARHIFSLNTCSGCHGGETQTFFTHVHPSSFGNEAGLSGFLTGITVTDAANRPSNSPTVRTFNDLQDRENKLINLTSRLCVKFPFFELAHKLTFIPNRMEH